MFNLESIKSKYKNVRFDLIGILFLVVGFVILYYGFTRYFGYPNYLYFVADLFGRTGGVVHSYETKQNKMVGLYFMITGFVIMGLGILGIYIHKKKV